MYTIMLIDDSQNYYIDQGRIQEFKKGGCFERVRAKRAEKFGVTTPISAKPKPVMNCTMNLDDSYTEKLNRSRLLCMCVELNCTGKIIQ